MDKYFRKFTKFSKVGVYWNVLQEILCNILAQILQFAFGSPAGDYHES